VVVLANQDGSPAPGDIERQLAVLLQARADDPDDAQALSKVRRIFDGLLEAKIDRSLLLRGEMTYRHFEVKFKEKALGLSTLELPGGKLARA